MAGCTNEREKLYPGPGLEATPLALCANALIKLHRLLLFLPGAVLLNVI